MNVLQLNIGLNVKNEESLGNLSDSLALVVRLGIVANVTVALAEGNWGRERTLCVRVLTDLTDGEVVRELRRMCAYLDQDAIAYQYNGIGDLVFHDHYSGERYEFNEDYFISI